MLKALLAGIRRRTVDILHLDLMGKKYSALAVNYVFLIFYTTLESVFVNTLLYSISPDISVVIYYRAVTYITSAVTMHFAAMLIHKKNPVLTIRVGCLFYLLSYAVLFIGMGWMEQLRYLVACLSGTGGAFYWAGHNVLVTQYTTKSNRDVGISALGVIQGIMTLFCPVISGFVISLMPGFSGYRVMFGVGMLAVVAQAYIAAGLPVLPVQSRKIQLRLALKLIWRKLTYKLLLAYEFIRGMRDGTFAFILNMLLFEIITNESLVGINTFLTGFMAIAGSWVYGRLVTAKRRGWITALSTTVLLAVCSSLFLVMNAATVMIFSVINAFMQLFIINSCTNTSYDIMSQNEVTRKCMGETLAFREGAMAAGRVTGLAIMMAFPFTQTGYVQAMCILTASQYLAAGFVFLAQVTIYRKRKQLREQQEGEPAS